MDWIAIANSLEEKRAVWIVAGLTTLLFVITNLPWQLDDYDQAKQAFTSFEMVKEGHWFYQRPNEKVATKPPLVGWLSAALFGASRSWAIAWRLPSFAAALALLALLGRTATKAYGPMSGLIAIGAFGLNMLSVRLATLVRTDMPLALIVFLLGWQIWGKLRRYQAWQTRDRVVTFILLSAAMLIKGPIVYAFLLPGIALFEWRARKTRHTVGAWSGWRPWLVSFAIFLLWVIGGILFAPHFFYEVVVREFAGRFGETMHRPQPIYFYLPHLLHKFAPWSILGIALLILIIRVERIRLREWWRHGSPEIVWLVCWSLGGLVMMSLIPSKRVDRIFPVLPPLCLLLAALYARALSPEKSRRRAVRWGAIALIFACLFNVAYSAVKIAGGYRENRAALAAFGRAARVEAEKRSWRYEVIGGRDEGMLLYFERLHFAEPDEVIAEWKTGEINAVIAPDKERPRLLRDLEGSVPSRLRSWKSDNDRVPHYIFLTRS